MAHVVETGAGDSAANAYLSAAEADAYWADHGAPATWTGADDVKEQAIRAATQAIDALFGPLWRGTRSKNTQALDWPRAGVDYDGHYQLSSTAIPQRLKDATAVLALEALVGGGTTAVLMPDLSNPGTVMAETKTLGPMSFSKSYSAGRSLTKWRPLVEGLLRPLVLAGGTVIRA